MNVPWLWGGIDDQHAVADDAVPLVFPLVPADEEVRPTTRAAAKC